MAAAAAARENDFVVSVGLGATDLLAAAETNLKGVPRLSAFNSDRALRPSPARLTGMNPSRLATPSQLDFNRKKRELAVAALVYGLTAPGRLA